MANHAFTRAGGVWNNLTVLNAAELADLDAKSVDSISATGGTYSITTDLVIGGSPSRMFQISVPSLRITSYVDVDPSGYLAVSSGADFYGAAGFYGVTSFFGASVQVQSPATFTDPVGFHDDVTLQQIDVAGTATFGAATTFNAPVTANDTLTCGNLNANGNVALGNAETDVTTVNARLEFAGNGRWVERCEIGIDGDTTYNPREVDLVYLPNGGVTGTAIYTISDTGAVDGDWIRFASEELSIITIKGPTGTTLANLQSVTGGTFSVKCQRVDGVWVVTSREWWP